VCCKTICDEKWESIPKKSSLNPAVFIARKSILIFRSLWLENDAAGMV
jgi:hypothetical protein